MTPHVFAYVYKLMYAYVYPSNHKIFVPRMQEKDTKTLAGFREPQGPPKLEKNENVIITRVVLLLCCSSALP